MKKFFNQMSYERKEFIVMLIIGLLLLSLFIFIGEMSRKYNSPSNNFNKSDTLTTEELKQKERESHEFLEKMYNLSRGQAY